MNERLHKLTVVVTGASQGIGFATVKLLLENGFTVTIWDIDDETFSKNSNQISDYSAKYFYHHCDVTNKEQVYSLAKVAFTEMGSVNYLINNAGYVKSGSFLDRTDDEWEKTIDINLTSFIYTIRAFLPKMYEMNFGHIINISSASSTLGVPNLAIYTATKWAVWGFTESMRFEAQNLGKNVKWTSVHPGYLKEGLFEGARIPFPGSLIVPLVKNHDVIAKAIVEDGIMLGKTIIYRPFTVRLSVFLRGILPDYIYQLLVRFLGITKSMNSFRGREGK